MANTLPTFELAFMGGGSLNNETWIDLSAAAPNPNSPIPGGSQLWLGFATFISYDKTLSFEIRPNLPGKSAGNLASTQLRAFASVLGGESKDVDMHFNGAIATLAPVSEPSTGVEKLWLRVKSNSSSLGTFDYILFYTVY